MNKQQNQFIKRVQQVGFDYSTDIPEQVTRKLFPASQSERRITIAVDGYLSELSSEEDITPVWNRFCEEYIRLCRAQGASIVTSIEVTPLVAFVSQYKLGETAIDTFDYLLAYNHAKLDTLLSPATGQSGQAWLNVYLFLEDSTRKIETEREPDRKAAALLEARTNGINKEALADREEFEFPYATMFVPSAADAAYIAEYLAKRSHSSSEDMTAQIERTNEVF